MAKERGSIMEEKLTTFTGNTLSKSKSTKMPYLEVLNKLNEIEKIYAEIMGPRDTWSQRLQDCIDEIRYTAMFAQTEDVEDLEQQYESRNSRDL